MVVHLVLERVRSTPDSQVAAFSRVDLVGTYARPDGCRIQDEISLDDGSQIPPGHSPIKLAQSCGSAILASFSGVPFDQDAERFCMLHEDRIILFQTGPTISKLDASTHSKLVYR